jgi:hypothetical protein
MVEVALTGIEGLSGEQPRQQRNPPAQTVATKEHVDWIKRQLQSAIASGELTKEDTWQIYSARVQMYTSDNNRIWLMGSFILPVAFSIVALVVSQQGLKLIQYIIVGVASTTLILVWNLFAEHHRAFQQKAEAWINAIQEVHGIGDPGSSKAGLSRGLACKNLRVQNIRWYLVVLTTLFWVAAAITR